MTPAIMGILNVTPDSFSDGGRFTSTAEAVAAGIALHEAGADLIDVGGESTRPGAPPVPLDEELRRVIPVIEGLTRRGIAVSIDSMKANVFREAHLAGAVMLNDVSALSADPESLAVAAGCNARIVLMHMPGNPRTMQSLAHYDDVVVDVITALRRRIAICEEAGISRDRLIVDPGIGFGKTGEQNLAIMRRLEEFHELGLPIMLGASRKSLISAVAPGLPPRERLGGSIALAIRAAEAGCAWVRVHDVAQTRQALALWQASRPSGA